jgi:hypothetical protein
MAERDRWARISKEVSKTRLIIDGDTYSDGGNRPCPRVNGEMLGFGGHVFKIRQGNKIWETNNLWHGGTIPYEYRELLKDNAEFCK